MSIKFLSGINVDSNTLFVDSTNNRVGIGTASPSYKLDVTSDIRIGEGLRMVPNGGLLYAIDGALSYYSSSNGVYLNGAGTNGWLRLNASGLENDTNSINIYGQGAGGYIDFNTGNSTRIRVTNNGNVGIGTTTVTFDTGSGLRIERSGASTIRLAGEGAAAEMSMTSSGYQIDSRNGYIRFITGAASGAAIERMRITSGGNALIGTTTDNGSRLQVSGSITASADISLGNTGINPQITFTGASIGGFTNGYIVWGGGVNTTPMLSISTPGSNFEVVTGYNEAVVLSTGAGFRVFTNNGSGTYTNRFQLNRNGSLNMGAYGAGTFTGTATQRLAVDASGNVIEIPIGSGPVDGNGTANYVTKWSDTDTITNSIIYDNGTNVGIGTTSPIYKLHVAGSTYVNGGTLFIDSGEYLRWGNSNQGIRGVNDTSLEFVSGGSERMRITAAGNVGIGTTGPSYKLHTVVASAADADIFQAAMSGVSNGFSVQRVSSSFVYSMLDGGLGINNASPTQALHVTGNARVTGAFIDSNNEAGTSGQVLSSTGSGTDWVTPATTTASSLYDLLPAARVAYNWTGQVVDNTWTDVFTSSTNVLTTGTWMVQMYIDDWDEGGGHYSYTYTGVMHWYQSTVNQGGESAASEIYLHRMGHAANSGVLYLRTTETNVSGGNIGKFQIKANYSNTSNTTINFKFVKIF